MTEPELRLKCLEFAISHARQESKGTDLSRIAEVTNEFYTMIKDKPVISQAPVVIAHKKPGPKPRLTRETPA